MVTSVNKIACNELLQYLKSVYKDISVTEGKVHKYLGMIFDFSADGKCAISMPHFISETIAKAKVEGVAATPATEQLFQVRENAPKLEDGQKEELHSLVMSLQYLAKRVRPDILCPVVFLSTRVQCADQDDWSKLIRIMKYLNGSKELGIVLEPDEGLLSVHSYVDASFAVHADFKSHTGIVITFGGGGIFFRSVKQKLNTTSSTEAELVGIADALPQIVQCREFLIHQGYAMAPSTLYQDNTSTIQLVKNGRSNSSRTRHINIRFFFIKDRVDAKELQLQHMPTDEMIADILTKPLQGEKFRALRAKLLNWY
jgi:histone deacetylase 1/2